MLPASQPVMDDAVMQKIAAALAAAQGEKNQAKPLPRLRNELRLLPAAPHADGSPAWMIHDPINNRFFRIGWLDFSLLVRWGVGEQNQLIQAVNDTTTIEVQADDVEALIRFLDQHSLLQMHHPKAIEAMNLRLQAQKKSWGTWLLHNYLFFRVPLIRPQRWLAAMIPWLSWIYQPATAWVMLLLTLLGVMLVVRQWDVFVHTFVDQLSWSGAAAYALALAFAKCLHELGHAFTATRYKVRVAHMGVAFLVMFPMLYTDTSESWRLSKPRQRMAIASAGIVAELALASFATLAWALSNDGPMRSALFFLATTSWLLTLALNLSPFMRFDGYFILCDLLDFPNLHERAIALARTATRRALLGWNDPWSEDFPTDQRRALIGFAWVTMLYRLFLYLGIALTVYFYFFKLLGIFLMLVECIWFIALPIWRELCIWWKERQKISMNYRIGWLMALLLLLGAGLWPWQSAVHAHGWLRPAQQQIIYAPFAGKLSGFEQARTVKLGQSLLVLEAPDLAHSVERAQALAQARQRELVGLSGLPDGEARRSSLSMQIEQFQAEAALYTTQAQRLQLTAPFSGELLDIDPMLAPGVWVQPRQPLATLVNRSQWLVEALVAEDELSHIRVGDAVSLWRRESVLQTLHGKVVEIDPSRTNVLPHPMLDAQSGGPIPTVSTDPNNPNNPQARLTPRDALYRVRISIDDPQGLERMSVVNLVIHGQAHAWLPRMARHIAAVAVRESGF